MKPTDLTYTVVGQWPFPIGMLARDGSVPATDEDDAKVASLCADHAPGDEPVSIDLVIRGADGRRPFAAKWESFDWSVVGDEGPAMRRAENERLAGIRRDRDNALAKLTPDEIRALEWYGLDRVS
jgi:hypothetical protein